MKIIYYFTFVILDLSLKKSNAIRFFQALGYQNYESSNKAHNLFHDIRHHAADAGNMERVALA